MVMKDFTTRLYEAIGRIMGRKWILWISELLTLANIHISPEATVGFVLTTWLALTLVVYFVTSKLFDNVLIGMGITFGFAAIYLLMIYTILLLRIDSRKTAVEDALPDFLQLAAANVRAGMAVDRAIWFAARPEFGLFSKEIEIVAKRTFGGEPFAKCLERMGDRFDSKLLKRTIHLIIDGIASGGEIADILEMTANDIRESQMLQKEISATMQMYVIFIIFASVIGAPVLYSLSNQLVSIMNFIWGNVLTGDIEKMPKLMFLSPSKPTIKTEDFFWFAIASTFITVSFASIIISVINTGEKKNGVKYLPILLVVGLSLFIGLGFVFQSMFSGIMK